MLRKKYLTATGAIISLFSMSVVETKAETLEQSTIPTEEFSDTNDMQSTDIGVLTPVIIDNSIDNQSETTPSQTSTFFDEISTIMQFQYSLFINDIVKEASITSDDLIASLKTDDLLNIEEKLVSFEQSLDMNGVSQEVLTFINVIKEITGIQTNIDVDVANSLNLEASGLTPNISGEEVPTENKIGVDEEVSSSKTSEPSENNSIQSFSVSTYAIQNFSSSPADELYNNILNAYFVSEIWNLAQDFKQSYPEDPRLNEVIAYAADKTLSHAKKLYNSGSFDSAMVYFGWLSQESLLSLETRTVAEVYIKHLSLNQKILTPDEYVQKYNSSYYISEYWETAQEFKQMYPADSRVVDIINDAAIKTFEYSKKIHMQGDFESALIYYTRLIDEPLLDASLIDTVREHKLLSESNMILYSADSLYDKVKSSYYVSDAWSWAKQFQSIYPLDSRVNELMPYATNLVFQHATKQHQSRYFDNAIYYYNLIYNDLNNEQPTIEQVTLQIELAKNKKTILSAQNYFEQIKKAEYISEYPKIFKVFKTMYPGNLILLQAVEYANTKISDYAIKQHNNGHYLNAIAYYNLILNEEYTSDEMRTRVSAYSTIAQENRKLVSPADYYNQIKQVSYISDYDKILEEFKIMYPGHKDLTSAIDFVFKKTSDYAVKQHKSKNYANAAYYYDKVAGEKITNKILLDELLVHKKQAENGEDYYTSNDYYNGIKGSKFVSSQWLLAQSFKKYYPNDSRVQETIDLSAKNILNFAMNIHKNRKFDEVVGYYNWLIAENKVAEEVRMRVNGFKLQAIDKQDLITPEKYYNLTTSSYYLYERWNAANNYKKYFRMDSNLLAAMKLLGERTMEAAVKNHKESKFETAAYYYLNVANEELIDEVLRIKAQAYGYLATNNLKLSNAIVRNVKYDISLPTMIDIQMQGYPQASSYGGWRDATKNEVEKYVNPNNLLPADLSNLTYNLTSLEIITPELMVRKGPSVIYDYFSSVYMGEKYVILDEKNGWYQIGIGNTTGWISGSTEYVKRDTDILQFLVLSGSSGISINDLNLILENSGILTGKGHVFKTASANGNINELYLISHAILETGYGSSQLATGIRVSEVDGVPVTPKVVYNMYGIGAYDSNPNKFGSETAYKLGWFTPEAAIIGGAEWISSSYINNPYYKQDTLYKMRWNPEEPGYHQYATDVAWASKQIHSLNSIVNYSHKYDLIMNFSIPIYQ